MERFELTGIDAISPTEDAGHVQAFLQAQGFDVQAVSVGVVDDQPTVWVTCDADPTKVLQSYVPTLTPDEQERADALADAQAAIDAIVQKPRGSRTATERVLLGLALGSDAVRVSGSIEKQAMPAERR